MASCVAARVMPSASSVLVIVTAVTKATAVQGRPGWIPADLNEGHLNKFYFLLAILSIADFAVYLVFASRYRKSGKVDGRSSDDDEDSYDDEQVAPKTCHAA